MSEKISGDIPPVPEFRGNLQEWSRDLTVYLERVLREHNADIETLHQVKQDVV